MSSVELLSQRQADTLDEIERFLAERGYPPTLAELADALGVTPNAARDHLMRLEGKGYIVRDWAVSRGIRVLRPVGAAPILTERRDAE